MHQEKFIETWWTNPEIKELVSSIRTSKNPAELTEVENDRLYIIYRNGVLHAVDQAVQQASTQPLERLVAVHVNTVHISDIAIRALKATLFTDYAGRTGYQVLHYLLELRQNGILSDALYFDTDDIVPIIKAENFHAIMCLHQLEPTTFNYIGDYVDLQKYPDILNMFKGWGIPLYMQVWPHGPPIGNPPYNADFDGDEMNLHYPP